MYTSLRLCIYTSGNHTFTSMKGPEDYDFLKACFEAVWKDLIKDPQYRLNTVIGSQVDILCKSKTVNTRKSEYKKHYCC